MIGVRTVNEREIDWLLISFDAMIVTNWDIIEWEGEPDMIPDVELSDNPIGSDPDEIENESSSPSTEGVMENSLSFVRTKEDWEYENEVMDWLTVPLVVILTKQWMIDHLHPQWE